jgi:hypothetical protein
LTLATIINYCTNDYRFLGKCIEEARHFSDQILIPVCDHFFDEKPENRLLLDHTYAAHPDCQFIEFAYSSSKLYSPFLSCSPTDDEWPHLWHSTARTIGFLHVKPETEYVLFLDCDEIPDGKRMAEWLKTGEHRQWNALHLVAYFYVLRPHLRAKKLQENPLLARRSALETRLLLHPGERLGTYSSMPEPKKGQARGHDLLPLFHHYSWVRTEEECHQKAATWAHRGEFDWPTLIRQTFRGNGNYFGSTHEFEEIPDVYFDPLSVPIPTEFTHFGSFPHVKKVCSRDIFKMEIRDLACR